MDAQVDDAKKRAQRLAERFEAPKKIAAQIVDELRNFGETEAQAFVNCIFDNADPNPDLAAANG